MNKQSTTLEQRIAVALKCDTDLPSAELAALIEEVAAVIFDAENDYAVDSNAANPAARQAALNAALAANGIRPLLPKLQARYEELHEQEQAAAWLAEREATWLARYDALKSDRDALAQELREVYPHAMEIAAVFGRIAANDEALSKLHRDRPAGMNQYLLSVELHARGLNSFSSDKPSLLTSVCLFDWDTGRQICPPRRPSMAQVYAETMMPASGRRFSGEWWKAREEGVAQQRRERQQMADYYARTTKEQEERENREARERFIASQRRDSV